MAECPNLPLEAQAAIERAREHIYHHAQMTWDMLFHPISRGSPGAAVFSAKPTPAILALQFREYAQALFNAEALHYCDQAKNEAELQICLKELAERIAAEVISDRWHDSHSFHCSRAECEDAMGSGLATRIEHWMGEHRKVAARKWRIPEDPIEPVGGKTARATTPEQSRHDKAKEMMARAGEVLEGSNAPTQKDQVLAIPHAAPLPKKRPRRFREPNLELLKNQEATLNRKNAAESLGVTERTLDRWIIDKELVPVGPGSRKRFRTKDLIRLLNRRNRDKADKSRQE
jgi:hypothetical protein